MALRRTHNWDTRELHEFFLARASEPFVWGKNDCCLFPADGIFAMTGVDIAADFRGKYADKASAFALIRTVTGGATVADAAAWCARQHNMPEWVDASGKSLPLMARRGDLVVLEDGGRTIAGLVALTGRHVISVGEEGLRRLPLNAVLRAWRVGA